jgi:hypothetical protein
MPIAPVPSIPAVLDISNVVGVFDEFEKYRQYLDAILLENIEYYSIFEEKLNRCLRLFGLMKDNYDTRFLPLSAAVPGGDSVMGCLANLSGKLGELREEFIALGFSVGSSAFDSASAVGSSFGGSGGGGAAAGNIPMAVVADDSNLPVSNLPVEVYAVAVVDNANLPVADVANPQGVFGGASAQFLGASASYQPGSR